jgi:hypothetical protein
MQIGLWSLSPRSSLQETVAVQPYADDSFILVAIQARRAGRFLVPMPKARPNSDPDQFLEVGL